MVRGWVNLREIQDLIGRKQEERSHRKYSINHCRKIFDPIYPPKAFNWSCMWEVWWIDFFIDEINLFGYAFSDNNVHQLNRTKKLILTLGGVD